MITRKLCFIGDYVERVDTLLNGNKIFQNDEGFLFGIDAVLLSDFAGKVIKKKDSLVDLCTGNAIIPLLVEKKLTEGKIFGVEIQKYSAALAVKSILENHLSDKIQILNEDLTEISKFFDKHSVEVVTCNPPYMVFNQGKQNPNEPKAIARHEIMCTLNDVVFAADYLLKTHGTFCMIHRPFRLPEIFSSLYKFNMEPKRMQLIYPFIDKEPNLVLIEARKNAQSGLQNAPPLVVREKNGEYTDDIKTIYQSLS